MGLVNCHILAKNFIGHSYNVIKQENDSPFKNLKCQLTFKKALSLITVNLLNLSKD